MEVIEGHEENSEREPEGGDGCCKEGGRWLVGRKVKRSTSTNSIYASSAHVLSRVHVPASYGILKP